MPMMLFLHLNMLKFSYQTNGPLLLGAKTDRFQPILKHVIRTQTKPMLMMLFHRHNMLRSN